MHIYEIQKNSTDEPICRAGIETQMQRMVMWTQCERVGWREKETLTYVNYQTQDWRLAESCYLAQGAPPGALLWPRGLGWGESRREDQEGRDICVYISLVAQMVKNLPAVQEKWREVKVTQSCLTLFCDPMDCTVHGILQSRILEWVAFPFSRDLPNPGVEPRSPALWADSFTSWAIREAYFQVRSLGREDPLVREMAIHSSILA